METAFLAACPETRNLFPEHIKCPQLSLEQNAKYSFICHYTDKHVNFGIVSFPPPSNWVREKLDTCISLLEYVKCPCTELMNTKIDVAILHNTNCILLRPTLLLCGFLPSSLVNSVLYFHWCSLSEANVITLLGFMYKCYVFPWM